MGTPLRFHFCFSGKAEATASPLAREVKPPRFAGVGSRFPSSPMAKTLKTW